MEFKPRNCRRWWRYICNERKQQVFDHSWRWRRSQHPGCDASINITGNGGNNSSRGSGGSHGHGGKTSGKFADKRRNKKKKKPISIFNPPGQEDDSKIYLNLIIEITNSNFQVFLFSEAPLRISKVQLSFPFSF